MRHCVNGSKPKSLHKPWDTAVIAKIARPPKFHWGGVSASWWLSAYFLRRDFSLKLKEDVVEDVVEEGAGEAEEEEEGAVALGLGRP